MTELDHLAVDLSGTALIEAGAGTGKTYAIVCLYLRLLLERRLPPERILVVTYTEAATRELRGRIRRRLREALAVLAGEPVDDPFLHRLCGSHPEPATARNLLEGALASFDTAAIFTIHGFCLRALQDHAFESGVRYDADLLPDQSRLLREIVEDFWRMRFIPPGTGLSAAGLTPEFLCDFVADLLRTPACRVEPLYGEAAIQRLEDECRRLFALVREAWRQGRGELATLLETHRGLRRSEEHYRADRLPALLAGMDAFTAGDAPCELFTGFEKFCSSAIDAQRLQRHEPPDHPFFTLCDGLHRAVAERLLALRGELFSFCRAELDRRKEERNLRSFDDLLGQMRDALLGPGGAALATVLRDSYPAALIDEFQDTDPLQYDIFRRIYGTTSLPLFLIGDPKQAIYSFRGADIFAYLRAVGETSPARRFTLTVNRRSTPGLLTAFNALFGSRPAPFVYDAIVHHPARPADGGDCDDLRAPGDPAPLQIQYLAEQERPLSIDDAGGRAAVATAGEIARLLHAARQGAARLGDRPLTPGDIAVIVRSHRQGQTVRRALQALAIPSVMRSDATVFASREAAELSILLQALLSPADEALLRAALTTDLLGRTGNDIAALLADEPAWESLLGRFREYHQLWIDKGFMVMGRWLLEREQVRERLLAHPDGERRLTNLLHCLELIHEAAYRQGLGPEAATVRFAEQVAGEECGEAYQLRLESDDAMVRIVTIHLSKGLEYPVVFCPFAWDGGRDVGQVLTLHDGFDMIKDFGSPDHARRVPEARRELLAENLRLLYVALTRARCRCYLVAARAGSDNRRELSPLEWLLASADGAETAPLEQRLRELAAASGGAIGVSPLPEGPPPPPLRDDRPAQRQPVHRVMASPPRSDWRVTSFTAFAAGDHRRHELPDRDETGDGAEPPPEPAGRRSIFTFPRGARTGIFLHELLEHLDFAAPSPDIIRQQVVRALEKHGFDREWLHPVTTMLHNLLTIPLSSPEGSFTLGGRPPGSWLPELEFFFPLRFISSERLAACLRAHGGPHRPPDGPALASLLRFRPVRGMVRGFVDLVLRQGERYYLLDWKSNHLGYRVEEYAPPALQREMERNLYPLQYLLYTVALHRYLGLRLPGYDYDRHFGGVIYLFLRGISPERGESCGVFRDRPSRELIEELTLLLIATERGET